MTLRDRWLRVDFNYKPDVIRLAEKFYVEQVMWNSSKYTPVQSDDRPLLIQAAFEAALDFYDFRRRVEGND